MICFKKILCPTDYSDSSFNALKYAIEMTIKDSAVLFLCTWLMGMYLITEGLSLKPSSVLILNRLPAWRKNSGKIYAQG